MLNYSLNLFVHVGVQCPHIKLNCRCRVWDSKHPLLVNQLLWATVSLRLFSSFALVSEVCASYESSVMMLQEQDGTVPEAWAAMYNGKKVSWLLQLVI